MAIAGPDPHNPPDRAPTLAVAVRGLTKTYAGVAVVDDVDLEIRSGEIFALLGPNGAGKTTAVEILEGFRTRDAGTLSVLGHDPGTQPEDLKSRLGIVLQSNGVDPYLTVTETITMYASYYPHPRPVDEVIELVGLDEKRHERAVRLSGGQQRRLDVAIALVGDPDLLFLDEPTTGFDPSARRDAWEVIKNLASLGKTVLLTTHYMDEAQYLADNVAVIARGRIVATGAPATLAHRDLASARIRFRVGQHAPPAQLTGPVDADGFTEFSFDDTRRALFELTSWALECGDPLDGLEVTRPSLEDVYLRLTEAASIETPAARVTRENPATFPLVGPTTGAARAPLARRASRATALLASQIRYVNKAFWRNPASAFFTFAFPLMFLVIFTSLAGNFSINLGTRVVSSSTYYVASMSAFAVITACFNNLAVAVSFQREAGILKRIKGTPLPKVSFLGARITHAMMISVVLVALTATFGRAFYQVDIPTGTTLVRFAIILIVGAASFCALGLALTGAIPNADSSAVIVNAVILPLLFLSGIFIPFSDTTPSWILWVARIFPVKHFVGGMQAGFLATQFTWNDVLIVAAWGLAGLLLANRYFSWEPSRATHRSLRGRRGPRTRATPNEA
ncbi:MAG TPA: ABC transporter ATP-binding protein/permease [Acidimicrobiales bacterium]|nr:ABC transporter ATP-binding protein/permease [Acidimicrobiales bacterium]